MGAETRRRARWAGAVLAALLLTALLLTAVLPAAVLLARGAAAAGGRAGEFDYYVLALSWSPAWCAEEGRERGAAQCDPARSEGFIVHGLWPQYERGGWPEYCRSSVRDPSPAETGAMAELMGSAGLVRYQWKKHGRCTGLDPADYFALIREAARRIRRPEVLRRVARPVRLPPEVVEEAFREANPELDPEEITVVCRRGFIREVRICLTRALEPRRCTGPAARECPLAEALFLPRGGP